MSTQRDLMKQSTTTAITDKANQVQLQTNEHNIYESIAKCINNNDAIQLCTNIKCKQAQLFICCDRKCLCKKKHSSCLKASLDFIMDVIKQKIHKVKQVKQFIQKSINKVVDQISGFLQHLLVQLENKMKFSQLNQLEKLFLNIVCEKEKVKLNQNEILTKFTSEESSLLWESVNRKQPTQNNIFKETQEMLKKFEESSKKNIQNTKKQVDLLIQRQKKYSNLFISDSLKKIQCKNIRDLTNAETQIVKGLLGQSNIVKTQEYGSRLVRFFPKKMQKMTLLYKASQHNFSLAKYYELCGSVTNTVILCETNKDKIVGGYTPFHYFSGINEYVPDLKRESFMFSLTTSSKFWLNAQNSSIYRRSAKDSIYFGNSQIYILDNANTNGSNIIRCNCYYMNQSYYYNIKQSYLSFNGNQTQNCTLKQWQVWKVELVQ